MSPSYARRGYPPERSWQHWSSRLSIVKPNLSRLGASAFPWKALSLYEVGGMSTLHCERRRENRAPGKVRTGCDCRPTRGHPSREVREASPRTCIERNREHRFCPQRINRMTPVPRLLVVTNVERPPVGKSSSGTIGRACGFLISCYSSAIQRITSS